MIFDYKNTFSVEERKDPRVLKALEKAHKAGLPLGKSIVAHPADRNSNRRITSFPRKHDRESIIEAMAETKEVLDSKNIFLYFT